MATHHVYTRTEYTEPLELLGAVEADSTPDLATALEGGDDSGWLEVAVMAVDDIVWVIRDGDLTGPAAHALTTEASS